MEVYIILLGLLISYLLYIYMSGKNKLCINYQGDKICIPKPHMNARQVISIQLNALKKNADKGIQTAYKYASVSNRRSTGPYQRFYKMVNNNIYKHLLECYSWKFIPGTTEANKLQYRVGIRVHSRYDNQYYDYIFELSRQYDFKKRKPLYDPYTGTNLKMYWRTDAVYLIESIVNEEEEDKNIYNEPLKSCKKSDNLEDNNGSWDSMGKCSETGGGVHQICMKVDNNTKDFSTDTGQSDWSIQRVGKTHCMCLGAWSLYKAKQKKGDIKQTNNELVCEAIPEYALTNDYLNKWSTWNGNELPGQIVEGVHSLVKQCYEKGNTKQKRSLRKNYKDMINKNHYKGVKFNEDLI